MNLVIVESPTKARTIKKFLGKGYEVESSFGHIMDLPKSTLGVDTDKNYEPSYIVPDKAKKVVTKLKGLAKKADTVILATDEDREGEAISWHLAQALKIKDKDIQRIVFHEITKSAIEKALENPRGLNQNLIDAQQARRVLDRLVGYKLSPFLWKKIARGLSAGRVQSVAVRLIVEREQEIQKFKSREYWTIQAVLSVLARETFSAELVSVAGVTLKKFDIGNSAAAKELQSALETAAYAITGIEKKKTSKSPLPPFTTATLQQTANARLGFSAKQTMTVAQRLYETGLITYMRTDSLNLSEQFVANARDYIKQTYGPRYLSESARVYKAKAKNAQEAHEAIRPTDAVLAPDKLKANLDSGQKRLYTLIWQRALATQAAKAELDNTAIAINAKNADITYGLPASARLWQAGLRATGQIITFDGYLKIYPQSTKENTLPSVTEQTALTLEKIIPEQHATEPAARYSDATLVKALEKYGIGRPSTYAPTIATIIARNYAERDDKKRLAPTDIAFIVNKLLVEHFPEIVDYQFTADLEERLDDVAAGTIAWQKPIDEFYRPFVKNLKAKNDELSKKDLTEEKTDEVCDQCSSAMIIKVGRFGKFLACSNYPECKNTKQLPNADRDHNGQKDSEQLKALAEKYHDITCDKCGSAMTAKVGRFGPFVACSNYPKCKNILDTNGTGVACPACAKASASAKATADKSASAKATADKSAGKPDVIKGEISQKRSRRGIFYACNQYPNCKFALNSKPTGEKCDKCGSLMVESKDGVKCSNRECKT